MINGTGTTSLRKSDLSNQKIAASGQKRTVFAHKATAGAANINLNSLTIPTEMSSIGFVNPSASDLANLNLLFNRSNLMLISSLRGVLMDYISYSMASSTQINFNGFTAAEGEIFTGVIQTMAQGSRVVDASPIIQTGTLTATTTDFNVGTPFELGKYPSQQVGAVLVFLDGVQQFRNTGNQVSPADGNYYELSAGAGLSTVIRFNQADITNDRSVLVVSNGLLAERPDGSMMAIIEVVNGKLNNMATYVAALAGVSTTAVQGSTPTNPDLKAFGDIVTRKAFLDVSNTWTAAQNFSTPGNKIKGRVDGSAPVAGEIGEVISTSVSIDFTQNTPANNTYYDITGANITLPSGVWQITATCTLAADNNTAGGSGAAFPMLAILSGASTLEDRVFNAMVGGGVSSYGLLRTGVNTASVSIVRNISVSTTYKVSIGKVIYGGIGALDLVAAYGVSYNNPIKISAIRVG